MTLAWRIRIDWDNDLSYAHDEAARTLGLRIDRGRPSQWTPFNAGKLVLILENNDRRFDPWFASSPLYPNVQPRRRIQVFCASDIATITGAAAAPFLWDIDGTDVIGWDGGAGDEIIFGAMYTLFQGTIEDIEPTGRIGQRTVTITAYDAWREWREITANEVTLQIGQTTGAVIGAVLDAIDWPTGDQARSLATGDTLSYFWVPAERLVSDLLANLAQSEIGLLFVDRVGRVIFQDRTDYLTGSAIVDSLDEDQITDLNLINSWDAIRNHVEIGTHQRTAQASGIIWQHTDPRSIGIDPLKTVTLWADYTFDDIAVPAMSVLQPVPHVDYQATYDPAPDVPWPDFSTDAVTVTVTPYGFRAKVDIYNDGSNPYSPRVYMTLLRLLGVALTETSTMVEANDATSQATYRKRTLKIDQPWRDDVEAMQQIADLLVTRYGSPQPVPTVLLDNVFPTGLLLDLGDKLSLTAASYSINAVFRVGALTLFTGVSMQDLKTTLFLEPVSDQTYWLLGEAGYSELGDTTWVGV